MQGPVKVGSDYCSRASDFDFKTRTIIARDLKRLAAKTFASIDEIENLDLNDVRKIIAQVEASFDKFKEIKERILCQSSLNEKIKEAITHLSNQFSETREFLHHYESTLISLNESADTLNTMIRSLPDPNDSE